MVWVYGALGIVLATCTLVYIGLPLLVRLIFRKQPADLRPIEEDDLPQDVRTYLQNMSDQLGGLGFDQVGWFADQDEAASQTTHCVVRARPSEMTCAMAAVVVSEQAVGQRLTSGMVELSSDFDDGHNLCTNTSDEILFPARIRPDRTVVQLPWVESVEELHRAHQQLCAWLARFRGITLTPLTPADPYRVPTRSHITQRMHDDLARDFQVQVKHGYMRRGRAEAYRLTLKGAFLLTWRQLWPISVVMRLRRNQAARELLARSVSGS